MAASKEVLVDKFIPRHYQKEAWEAIEKDGYKRLLLVAPRRSGKDLLAWSLCLRIALRKCCMVLYCLPTYSQAKKCVFDAIDSSGNTFLSYIPKELIASVNSSDMKIRLVNNSLIQLVGADSYNTSLVGTNPSCIVFSEYALCDPAAFEYARPILAANGGVCILVSTPRGKNHLYNLYNEAIKRPEWKVILQKTSEINHIPAEALAREKEQLEEELYLQEFECSFSRGLEGSIYGKYIDKMKLNGQIADIPHDPMGLVYLAFDIGLTQGNETCLLWYQTNGKAVYVIDCYSGTDLGLDSYVKIIKEKPYRMGGIFAPWDMAQREWGGGAVTRFERARQMGLELQVLKQSKVQDGIDLVYTTLPRVWIDQTRCRSLVDALENYRRTWDEQKQVHSDKPVHNWASNYADAFRYLCASLEFAQQGMTSEDFDRAKNQALYGNRNNNQWDKWIR